MMSVGNAQARFAVCIPTRNRPVELRRAIASALAGSVKPTCIVVTDDSDEAHAERVQAICASFPEVIYVRGPKRGLGPNRNNAIRALPRNVEFVSFIDDDAEFRPDFFTVAQELVRNEPETIHIGHYIEAGVAILPHPVTYLGFQEGPEPRDGQLCVAFSANVIPIQVFERCSFDEHIVYGYEESDFAATANSAGFPIRYCSRLIAEHPKSPLARDLQTSAVLNRNRLYTGFKRLAWVERRWGAAAAFAFIAPVHLIAATVKRREWDQLPDNVKAILQAGRMCLQNRPRPACLLTPKSVSVVVPTYKRPGSLRRCLLALLDQTRPADQVVIVVRSDDEATRALMTEEPISRLPLTYVTVTAPGQVAALNAGLAAASGDIIAITDDDAAPRPDWLERILDTIAADPNLGGVGGRDVVHHPDGTVAQPAHAEVGRIRWHGRIIGNHHTGTGPGRDVDILKGANMAFRRAAVAGVAFDNRLRGSGAQVHNDLAFSLAVKRQGWRLRYDPAIVVDHFPAARFDADQRGVWNRQAARNAAYNEILALATYLPWYRAGAAVAYAFLVGTRHAPGMIVLAERLLRENDRRAPIARFIAAMEGRIPALRDVARTRLRRVQTSNSYTVAYSP